MIPAPFPGTEAPLRQYHLVSSGVRIAVHEWGDETADPLFLVHGGSDFARTYDVFAPLLAAAGWRVIAWDQRGHGDSGRAALYGWDSDIRDAIGVMDRLASKPAVVVAHSKGGALSINLADAHPFRFSHLVNIDGMPSRRPMSDLSEHQRTKFIAADIGPWLDHRRHADARERKPGTIDELAARRQKSNPRSSMEWLRYLVTVGATESADGWRWKLDPSMRPGGFGPWRPEWTMTRMPGLGMPFLGMLCGQPEPMAWGTKPEEIRHLFPSTGRLEVFEDAGHFIHIEQPHAVAEMVLDFLEHGR